MRLNCLEVSYSIAKYDNVASAPPHVRQATMRTEGLRRENNSSTEHNVQGSIGETDEWPVTAH